MLNFFKSPCNSAENSVKYHCNFCKKPNGADTMFLSAFVFLSDNNPVDFYGIIAYKL